MLLRYSDAMASIPMTDERIAELRKAYDRCFGCGVNNPIGLHLDDFSEAPDGATGRFTPEQDFNGFHDILHGGVIATALDEISAWSAILSEGVFIFTAKLEIRYRAEAHIDQEYTLVGTVSQRRGKRLLIDALMRTDDAVVAESSGLFVVAGTLEDLLAPQRDITTR
jgi:acyl-coenzyme A thioesterase PaaI-like protein